MNEKTMPFDKEGLYFIPMGGSEQFGANLNVYVSQGKLLAVDCGIGFADEQFPGIDILLPDPSLLEDNMENLEALIITHAHEDHVGAAALLWNRLRCPIYCTAFTAAILQRKLEEEKRTHVEVNIVQPMDQFDVGPFHVQFVPVAHSIPDTCSLIIETKEGRVVHSGDWNLDPHPVAGYETDPGPFKAAGKKGVLAYIGDSTNAQVKGRAGSESEAAKGLAAEFKECEGRIIVTCFSSNIGRITSIARAAKEAGRDVGVVGRSLHRMIGAARQCGYMDDVPEFVPEEDLGLLPHDKAVIIATGSQGEYRAALAKMSRGDHQSVTLGKGDTVIFSARAIPGNEKSINTIKDNLSAAGVQIVTPRDTKNVIHVSGHPCRDEMADMYQWVKPKVAVPVHGGHMQLQAHADLARSCQIQNVIVPKNGSVIRLAPGKAEIVDHIETGLLAVERKRIIDSSHNSISTRRKLQYTGAVHVTVVLDARGEMMAEPRCDTVGLIDHKDAAEQQFEKNMHEEIEDLLEDMTREERMDDHFVSEELRIGMRRFVYHFLGIKPKTTVHMVRI